MTLLRFLSVTTYRYYLQQFLDSIIPTQRKSAISLIVDFRNPKTIDDADFRNPKTITDVDFITIQEI